MVYFEDPDIVIRDMEPSDAQPLVDAELAQGWHADITKYLSRLDDRAAGKAVVLTAVYRGEPAGYVSVYRGGHDGPFAGRNIPEIVDLGVLEKYRGSGIGRALMDAAESVAARCADTVYLGVGLHSGYGAAQRMYAKRGYIPDGTGVWYGGKPAGLYGGVCNDDDLVLYLSKKLR